MKQTVGVADDHVMFRKGLIEIISHMPAFNVILEAGDGNELLRKLDAEQPAILILDLKMPNLDGFEAVKIIGEKFPGIKLIVLSMYDQEKFVLHAFQLGVHGYLLKNSGPEELEEALHKVGDEGFYFTDRVGKILAKGLQKKSSKPQFNEVNLTSRELQILSHICEGLTNKEISKKIYLSKRTVEGYRKNLILKAEVSNTACLVSWAFRNGLVE